MQRIDAGLDGTVALVAVLESNASWSGSAVLRAQLLDVVAAVAKTCAYLLGLPEEEEAGMRQRRALYAMELIQRAIQR